MLSKGLKVIVFIVLLVSFNSVLAQDICSDAQLITVTDPCNSAIIDIWYFSASGVPTNTITCDPGNNASRDAWFKFIVPDDDTYLIRTIDLNGNYIGTEIELFIGICGSLDYIGCSELNLSLGHSEISISDRPAGQIIFIRVGTRHNNSQDPFGLCISETINNDFCSEAIEITTDGNCSIYDNTLTSASNEPSFALSCGIRDQDVKDMWFKVTVPLSGNVQIDIESIADGLIDTDMEVYSGGCASLIVLACNSYKEVYNNPHARIELENRTPMEILYVRVIGRNNTKGKFQICANDMGYTYPCRIDLVELINQSECDPFTNTFSQQIRVTYRVDDNATGLIISISGVDQTFVPTGSPQLITIENLPANGNKLDVFAGFEREAIDASCATNTFYSASRFINAPLNCYTGIVANDECNNAIYLEVEFECNENIFYLIGATTSNDYYENCAFTADNLQDVWFKFDMPLSGEVLIKTTTCSSVEAIFFVYAGNCNDRTLIASSCGGSRSIRIKRPYDEEIFVLVADQKGGSQGSFSICVFDLEPFNNDNCVDAINVLVTSSCIGKIYSDHHAQNLSGASAKFDCENFEYCISDLWFKVKVPSSGNVQILTEEVERENAKIIMEVYSNNCNSLNLVECFSRGRLTVGHALIKLYNRSPGEELYIRVDSRRCDNFAYRICAIDFCPDDTYVDFDLHNETTLQSSGIISSNSAIEANVTFDAKGGVELYDQFSVESDKCFQVDLTGCSNY